MKLMTGDFHGSWFSRDQRSQHHNLCTTGTVVAHRAGSQHHGEHLRLGEGTVITWDFRILGLG